MKPMNLLLPRSLVWESNARRLALLLVSALWLAGCAATRPPLPPAGEVLHDTAFGTPPAPMAPEDVFAFSPAMRDYLNDTVQGTLRRSGTQRGLYEALYAKQQLRLEYDAERTRTAAEAFEARAGNCLSLAIMTGAFARELGLGVRYQVVDVASTWGRSGNLVLHNGHVNVALQYSAEVGRSTWGDNWLVIDFIPLPAFYRPHATLIEETRVIAMYMNNRAAEELAAGRVAAAYWWARAAVQQDAAYADAYNTLGVIYRRHGQTPWAEAALRRTLLLDGDNANALDNLASLLRGQGRQGEAEVLTARLERLQADAPFVNYERGMQALRAGEYRLARDLLEKELPRTNGYHEVHLGLAIAYLKLGDAAAAARHLEQARDNSTTRQEQGIYAAKLQHLREMMVH